jgi:hypothetical protein
MTVVLAATYHPRGEVARLGRLLPQLQATYVDIVISLPPTIQPEDAYALKALPDVRPHVNGDWSHGRYMALKLAFETSPDYVHYADLDRLLRWVETRPDEWRRTVERVGQADCLVIGRTERAWATHPQALRQTEAITNSLFSTLLGQPLDLSAGSKGFSRRAVEFLLANSQPGRAMGADSEWIVLLHRAGFRIDSLLVDGLDWESADRYRDAAADMDAQRQAALAYDADPAHWAARVAVAQEIVEAGLDALQRHLKESRDAHYA